MPIRSTFQSKLEKLTLWSAIESSMGKESPSSTGRALRNMIRLVCIMSVLIFIVDSMQMTEVLAAKTKCARRNVCGRNQRLMNGKCRPKVKAYGPDDRSWGGVPSSSNIINSLVSLHMTSFETPGGLPGSFAGVGIALDKEHMLVDYRVRERANWDALGAKIFCPNPGSIRVDQRMAYNYPPNPQIDTTMYNATGYFHWDHVQEFGIYSIIKVKTTPPINFQTSVEIAKDLRKDKCILYSWGLDYADIKKLTKRFVQHRVVKLPEVHGNTQVECDTAICRFELGDLPARICPWGPDYGSPIFCDGKLSYIVYSVDTAGARECQVQFQAVNLSLNVVEIQEALKKSSG